MGPDWPECCFTLSEQMKGGEREKERERERERERGTEVTITEKRPHQCSISWELH